MKEQIFTVMLGLFGLVGTVQAQNAFEKNRLLINAGTLITKGGTPISLSAEYVFLNHIGIGLRAHSEYSLNRTIFTGSTFVNYHFTPIYKIDSFVGLSASKTFSSREENLSFNNTYASIQVGARYFFVNRLGVYTQAVVPLKSNITPGLEVGISFKIEK